MSHLQAIFLNKRGFSTQQKFSYENVIFKMCSEHSKCQSVWKTLWMLKFWERSLLAGIIQRKIKMITPLCREKWRDSCEGFEQLQQVMIAAVWIQEKWGRWREKEEREGSDKKETCLLRSRWRISLCKHPWECLPVQWNPPHHSTIWNASLSFSLSLSEVSLTHTHTLGLQHLVCTQLH